MSEFIEEEHPRGEGGKFASKDGGKINIQLFANDYTKQTDKQLLKSIKSLEQRIIEHHNKVCNPSKEKYWNDLKVERQQGLIQFWEKEISGYRKQIDEIKIEQKRRNKNGCE